MDAVLIASSKDTEFSSLLEQAFTLAGHSLAHHNPDLPYDALAPEAARKLQQTAECCDYFLYILSRHTENAPWLNALSHAAVEQLSQAGAKVVLLVIPGGQLPPHLAFIPCVYLQDEAIITESAISLVDVLDQVESIQPLEMAVLRFYIMDLESFLETGQSLGMVYRGLESACDDTPTRSPEAARAALERFGGRINFGGNYLSHMRLEAGLLHQQENRGMIGRILSAYQELEHEWLHLAQVFTCDANFSDEIRMARARASSFANLVYLILALRLLPYCENYLHERGLKQKSLPHAAPPHAEAASAAPPPQAGVGQSARLSFLFPAGK